jgi:acyl-CoA thioester hydrolase
LPVRYADTDGAGHVFFANYLIYADEGYTAHLEALDCSYAELEALGVYMVYAHSSCSHRGSARFGDRLRIHTRIAKAGRTSLTIAATVQRADEVLAEVQLVSVCMSLSTRQPIEIPRVLREAIARHEGETLGDP